MCPRADQFKCYEGRRVDGIVEGGACVEGEYAHDGTWDCPDKSDECKWTEEKELQ